MTTIFGYYKINSYLCTHGTITIRNHRHHFRDSTTSVHPTPQEVNSTVPRAPFGRARSDTPYPSTYGLQTIGSESYARGAQSLGALFGRSVSFVACRSCRVRWAQASPAPRAWLLCVPLGAPLSLPPSRLAPADTSLPTFPLRSRARPSLHAPVRLQPTGSRPSPVGKFHSRPSPAYGLPSVSRWQVSLPSVSSLRAPVRLPLVSFTPVRLQPTGSRPSPVGKFHSRPSPAYGLPSVSRW